ncbi:hypothetical protein D3C79_886130 [compost metagenome]
MLVGTGLVLGPEVGQLATPHPVPLHLAAKLLQAQLHRPEVARQLLEPGRRRLAHEARIHQVGQLLLDVVQRHRLAQVDLAFETLLQAVPQLEHFQRLAGQALGMLGPAAALALGKPGQCCAIAR